MGNHKKPTVVESLEHRDEAVRLIREGGWQEVGKTSMLTVENGGVAYAIRRILQRYVQGHTPAFSKDAGDKITITTRTKFLKEAQKQLSKEVGV
ncbi:MAG: hypothetical protein AB7F82_04815 [Alphaproteobacteria bacterium]